MKRIFIAMAVVAFSNIAFAGNFKAEARLENYKDKYNLSHSIFGSGPSINGDPRNVGRAKVGYEIAISEVWSCDMNASINTENAPKLDANVIYPAAEDINLKAGLNVSSSGNGDLINKATSYETKPDLGFQIGAEFDVADDLYIATEISKEKYTYKADTVGGTLSIEADQTTYSVGLGVRF